LTRGGGSHSKSNFLSQRELKKDKVELIKTLQMPDELHSGISDGSTGKLEWARRFQHIVESGDINAKLKPKYNIKKAKEGIKFKRFILD
jgi:hypothetical protein